MDQQQCKKATKNSHTQQTHSAICTQQKRKRNSIQKAQNALIQTELHIKTQKNTLRTKQQQNSQCTQQNTETTQEGGT